MVARSQTATQSTPSLELTIESALYMVSVGVQEAVDQNGFDVRPGAHVTAARPFLELGDDAFAQRITIFALGRQPLDQAAVVLVVRPDHPPLEDLFHLRVGMVRQVAVVLLLVVAGDPVKGKPNALGCGRLNAEL